MRPLQFKSKTTLIVAKFIGANNFSEIAKCSTAHSWSLMTHHCLTSFLFDTNKAHKIIILVRALLKTKEKRFSIQYKFALSRNPQSRPAPGIKNVRNLRCYSNAACLAVLVVLTCPAASGPTWFAWLGMGA